MERLRILFGDAVEMMRGLPDASLHCCVTSPPYWGLRDYKVAGQIGQERTPEEYVAKMVEVFREVRRVLRNDGTVWLNLGDSYANDDKWGGSSGGKHVKELHGNTGIGRRRKTSGLKPKDLIGIPWRVALALQADGWWLRSDIIWAKRNTMPESVTDRPTRSHEYIFLLSKSARYYYDAEAIKEPCIYDVDGTGTAARTARTNGNKLLPTAERNGIRRPGKQRGHSRRHDGLNDRWDKMEREQQCTGMRNKRDVWAVAPANYPDAHFATYPPDLIKPCILAGCPVGGVVLDPFAGSGTTGQVALELGRAAVLIELNPDYVKFIERRCDVTPGLALA